MAAATTFRTEVLRGGKTATGIEVPPRALEELGTHKRPPVIVEVAGHSYSSTVAVMAGRYLVPLSAENRRLAGVDAGDVVDVTLTLDTTPRIVEVPDDLAAALAAHPAAAARFASLSNSAKRRHTLSVEGAKTAATRRRRVERSVADLAS
jgi:hypothetical protein